MSKAIQKELTEEEYEEKLDDIYGTVEVCGMTFGSGRALKELDPIAFRTGMNDEPEVWVCSKCESEYETEEEARECCEEEDDEE